MIPRCAGTDEDVLLYLNARIPVYATERNSVNLTAMRAAERRAAHPAETKTPSRRGFVENDVTRSLRPGKRSRLNSA